MIGNGEPQSESFTLWQGDCLELMKNIPDSSVDMVLCDLPYGTTACKWDVIINFDDLWRHYNRVVKDTGAVVLFSKNPFTARLIYSNLKNFRYTLVWKKDNHDNPLMAKKRFLNITEDVCVFYKKQCTYNPQGIIPYNKITNQGRGKSLSQVNARNNAYLQKYTNYPRNILEFKRDLPGVHPTQKPVALCEYLSRTFTNEGELILDNCMGSGSTGVACINTGRRYIGMELDKQYFDIAKNRILKAAARVKAEGTA